MWPLGDGTEEPLSKAEIVASSLVELCKDTSSMFLKGLLGEDVSTASQALIEPVNLEVLLFALHLTDRLTFVHLRSGERALFMEALLPAVKRLLRPPLDANLADLYNVRQQFYGGFAKLCPDGDDSLKGTLFWEFGKALAAVYADYNPVAATLTSAAGMDLLKLINEVLLSTGIIRG